MSYAARGVSLFEDESSCVYCRASRGSTANVCSAAGIPLILWYQFLQVVTSFLCGAVNFDLNVQVWRASPWCSVGPGMGCTTACSTRTSTPSRASGNCGLWSSSEFQLVICVISISPYWLIGWSQLKLSPFP